MSTTEPVVVSTSSLPNVTPEQEAALLRQQADKVEADAKAAAKAAKAGNTTAFNADVRTLATDVKTYWPELKEWLVRIGTAGYTFLVSTNTISTTGGTPAKATAIGGGIAAFIVNEVLARK